MTRKLNTYLNDTSNLIAENHSSEEYADKQKQKSLAQAGSIDIEEFMQSLDPQQKCVVEIMQKGRVKTRVPFETDSIYTIWYDEIHNRWCYMGQKIEKGALDEHI